MKFSICIPSYNRGHRAWPLVEQLLGVEVEGHEIEIVFSNNNSTENTEGYEKMRSVNQTNFHYYEQKENIGYAKNFNFVIEQATGEFCMILTDEDLLYEPNLGNYLYFLSLHPEISVMKPLTSVAYSDLITKYYPCGEESVDAFYLEGSKISGTIYNRSIITNEVLKEIESRYGNGYGYSVYVQLFVDAFALVNGSYCSSDMLLVDEGPPDDKSFWSQFSGPVKILPFATYENRWKEMHEFVTQIIDIDLPMTIQFQMFVRVIDKVSFWIGNLRNRYEEEGDDWNYIASETAKRMKNEFERLELPVSQDDIDRVFDYIDSLTIHRTDE